MNRYGFVGGGMDIFIELVVCVFMGVGCVALFGNEIF